MLMLVRKNLINFNKNKILIVLLMGNELMKIWIKYCWMVIFWVYCKMILVFFIFRRYDESGSYIIVIVVFCLGIIIWGVVLVIFCVWWIIVILIVC